MCVNDHWQQMKGIMMETAQDICGMKKGPCRHKETCHTIAVDHLDYSANHYNQVDCPRPSKA